MIRWLKKARAAIALAETCLRGDDAHAEIQRVIAGPREIGDADRAADEMDRCKEQYIQSLIEYRQVTGRPVSYSTGEMVP